MAIKYITTGKAAGNPELPIGSTVYLQRGHDYGLARDDSRANGHEHVSVTLNPDGDYPGFTIRRDLLEAISAVPFHPAPEQSRSDQDLMLAGLQKMCEALGLPATYPPNVSPNGLFFLALGEMKKQIAERKLLADIDIDALALIAARKIVALPAVNTSFSGSRAQRIAAVQVIIVNAISEARK